MSYGFTCWSCGEHIEFDGLPQDYCDQARAAEYLAGLQGWGVGHFDGQGQIACGNCEHSVWDFIRFDAPYHSETMPLSEGLSTWLAQHQNGGDA